MPTQPIVLDLDGSVGELPGRLVVPLREHEEGVRFGCSLGRLRRLGLTLDATLPREHGTVFLGSGDFHHITWPLVARVPGKHAFQVVVLDNHPDNMRFPFGVHCGSWVRRVAMMPRVTHVHVIGITSHDIGKAHAWENYLGPLKAGKLTYWSNGVDTRWAARMGLETAFRTFPDADAMVEDFVAMQMGTTQPVYLSIDKDAYAPDVAMTNWDQGTLSEAGGDAIIRSLHGRIIGSDVTGDISRYAYKTWWKRRLSAMDEQPDIDPLRLRGWQVQQHALNLRLLDAIRS
jgi:hypothetical protein